MAIWSSFHRVSNVLSRIICKNCDGNGQLPMTREQIEQMICGGNICDVCSGSGFKLPNSEILKLIEKTLE